MAIRALALCSTRAFAAQTSIWSRASFSSSSSPLAWRPSSSTSSIRCSTRGSPTGRVNMSTSVEHERAPGASRKREYHAREARCRRPLLPAQSVTGGWSDPLFLMLLFSSFIGRLFVDIEHARPVSVSPLKPPSWELPFGSDKQGRDLFAVMVVGHAADVAHRSDCRLYRRHARRHHRFHQRLLRRLRRCSAYAVSSTSA